MEILRAQGEVVMKVSEEALLNSGFTHAELQKIKNNIEIYGGTLDEAIHDLRNRFRVLLWIVSGCFCIFLFLLLFSSESMIVGGGLSLLITIAIVTFIQPPIMAYKSWRYWLKD